MRKKNTVPSAFEDAFTNLGLSNPMGTEEVTNIDELDSFVDVEPFKEEKKPSEEPLEDGKEPEAKTDVTDIPQEVLDRMNGKEPTEPNPDDNNEPIEPQQNADELTDDDVTEAQQVAALFDAVADKFGWNAEDIDEETRPVTVEGLVDYLHDVVEENSIPEYADERIQQLDEYVKRGGRFEDFYAAQQ